MNQLTLGITKPTRIFHTLRSGEVVPIYYDPAGAKRWRKGKPAPVQRMQLHAQKRWWERYFGEAAKEATEQLHRDQTGGFAPAASGRDVDIEEGIDWIEQLIIPTGPAAGSRLYLMEWQKDWIRGVMTPGIRIGGLSVSRKNAKTVLNCAIALAFLCGPWHRPNWAGILCADKVQNAQVFTKQLMELAGASALMNQLKLKKTSPGRVLGKDGAELQILAAEKHGSGHASNADIAWIDECGALQANDRPLYEAMLSSISARDGKFIAVGNQREGPMFREMEAEADLPHVHWERFTTPVKFDLMDEESWYLGNPGLGVIKPVSYMRERAASAKAVPAKQSYFRSFDLNQAIEPDRQLIVQEADWVDIELADAKIERESAVAGIDMGGSLSMTAMVVIGLESGIMEAWGAWGDTMTLLERGRADGVDTLYIDMEKRGELIIYPNKVVPGGQFIWDIMQILAEREVRLVGVGADRKWREEMSGALRDSGYRGTVQWRGTGGGGTWADGANDVRAFQRIVLEREIRAKSSLLMRSAIISSTLEVNARGNPSLDKGSHARNSRIDALQAGVIAAGLFEREREQTRQVEFVGGEMMTAEEARRAGVVLE